MVINNSHGSRSAAVFGGIPAAGDLDDISGIEVS